MYCHMPQCMVSLVQAASKTNDTAGDGTTTATILSAAIIAEGMKIVAAGTNPVQLCRGIETTVAALVKDLQAMSTDVTDADLANVATVSAGGNEVVRPVLPPSACSSPFLSKASDQLRDQRRDICPVWTCQQQQHDLLERCDGS